MPLRSGLADWSSRAFMVVTINSTFVSRRFLPPDLVPKKQANDPPEYFDVLLPFTVCPAASVTLRAALASRPEGSPIRLLVQSFQFRNGCLPLPKPSHRTVSPNSTRWDFFVSSPRGGRNNGALGFAAVLSTPGCNSSRPFFQEFSHGIPPVQRLYPSHVGLARQREESVKERRDMKRRIVWQLVFVYTKKTQDSVECTPTTNYVFY